MSFLGWTSKVVWIGLETGGGFSFGQIAPWFDLHDSTGMGPGLCLLVATGPGLHMGNALAAFLALMIPLGAGAALWLKRFAVQRL